MATQNSKTIRHVPFFRALSDIQPGENGWNSIFAGLSVLRLVDSYSADAAHADQTETLTIESTRRAAKAVPPTDPVRSILLRVLDGLESGGISSAPGFPEGTGDGDDTKQDGRTP